jgi:hypothetical protein
VLVDTTGYPVVLQHKVVDLLYSLNNLQVGLIGAITTCMHTENVSAAVVAHVVRVVHLRTEPNLDVAEAAQLFTFAASTAIGYSSIAIRERVKQAGGDCAFEPARQMVEGADLKTVLLDHAADPVAVRMFYDRRIEVWSSTATFASRLGWPRTSTFGLLERLIRSLTKSSSAVDGLALLPYDATIGLACLVARTITPSTAGEQLRPEPDSVELETFLAEVIWRAGLWTFGQHARATPGEPEAAWATAAGAVVEVFAGLIQGAATPPDLVGRILQTALTTVTTDSVTMATDVVATARLFTALITCGVGADSWKANRDSLQRVVVAVGGSSRDAPRPVERFAAEVKLL